jgi:hypothetical protein
VLDEIVDRRRPRLVEIVEDVPPLLSRQQIEQVIERENRRRSAGGLDRPLVVSRDRRRLGAPPPGVVFRVNGTN